VTGSKGGQRGSSPRSNHWRRNSSKRGAKLSSAWHRIKFDSPTIDREGRESSPRSGSCLDFQQQNGDKTKLGKQVFVSVGDVQLSRLIQTTVSSVSFQSISPRVHCHPCRMHVQQRSRVVDVVDAVHKCERVVYKKKIKKSIVLPKTDTKMIRL